MKPQVFPSAGGVAVGYRNPGPGMDARRDFASLSLGGSLERRSGWERSSLRNLFILLMAVVAASAIYTPASQAQLYGLTQRLVRGRVLDANGQPQPNAIVYLQNEKTNEIRTYITEADGSYRFGQLSSDVDYRLWAKLQNWKSKARTISSFDSKKLFIFDLKLERTK